MKEVLLAAGLRHSVRWFSIFFILLVIFLPTLLHPLESMAAPKCLCFTWAFIVAGVGGPDQILDMKNQPVIHSGEKLRIVIMRETGGVFYLFRIDSQGQLTIPHSLLHVNGNKIKLPREGKWYTVDQSTGMETFYLLASTYPLDLLEKALRIYDREPKSARAKAAVLEEIEKARSSNSEPYGEEWGVPIEGTKGKATRVNVDSFYKRTVRLQHE